MDLLLKNEVFAIVGAAMEVHHELGPGFLEAVYQEAMEVELEERGIPCSAQKNLPIWYKERPLKKEYVADLHCYGQIIVELKALDRLGGKEQAQLLNYLHASRSAVGLVINFGSHGQLEWKRFVL